MRNSPVWRGRLPDFDHAESVQISGFRRPLGGLAYVAVFSLANFVKYQPREIIVTIPPDKFLKNH